MDPLALPVFVVCRDRVACLRELVQWLETAGHHKIVLVDNASTYPPLLDYLSASTHRVERLGANLGHRSPWLSGLVERVAGGGRYVVTDPDVLPDENCPHDAVAHLSSALDRYPGYIKAGLGLRIDDLPAHYANRDDVIAWESQFWQRRLRGQHYRAIVDTTFAVYRDGQVDWPGVWPSVRTGTPYVARHLPWYVDSSAPTDEDQYYEARCRTDVTNWRVAEPTNDQHRVDPRSTSLTPFDRLRWRVYVARHHWHHG